MPPKTSEELSDWLNYLSRDEVTLLKNIARSFKKPPVIVNIGAGAGTSGLAFKESRSDMFMYTVDVSPGGPLGGIEGEHNAFVEAGVEDYKNYARILGKSHDVAKRWHLHSYHTFVDLVFVDDGHLEDDIRGDILGWLPIIVPGGIIMFHDYGSERWPDVKKVVDELMVGKEVIAHTGSIIAFRV